MSELLLAFLNLPENLEKYNLEITFFKSDNRVVWLVSGNVADATTAFNRNKKVPIKDLSHSLSIIKRAFRLVRLNKRNSITLKSNTTQF